MCTHRPEAWCNTPYPAVREATSSEVVDLKEENDQLHTTTQRKIERYRESLCNVTPADVYFGRKKEINTGRVQINRRTLKKKR